MIDDKKHTIVLQSCPLCGGKAVMHTQRDEKRREILTYVKCSVCGAKTITFPKIWQAITAWNLYDPEHKAVKAHPLELTSVKQEMQTLLDQLMAKEFGDEAETYTSGYRVGHHNGQVELLQYLLKIDTGTQASLEESKEVGHERH